MPRNPELYELYPGPFWYEDRIIGERVPCAECNRRAQVLWVFRTAGINARAKEQAVCNNCMYTPAGYIMVQLALRG